MVVQATPCCPIFKSVAVFLYWVVTLDQLLLISEMLRELFNAQIRPRILSSLAFIFNVRAQDAVLS